MAIDLPPPPPAYVLALTQETVQVPAAPALPPFLTRETTRALNAGDLDLRLGTGTNPRVRGSGGWALWALSWWGFEGSAELGVARLGPFSLSAGGQLSYGQPIVLQTATNGALAYFIPQGATHVSARSVGLDGRAALHVGREQGWVHPYLVSAMGPRWLKIEASRDGSVVDGYATWSQLSWSLTPSVGMNIVLGRGFVLNAELGWSQGVLADADSQVALNAVGISVVDKQGSGEREAPRGMVYSSSIGWRF